MSVDRSHITAAIQTVIDNEADDWKRDFYTSVIPILECKMLFHGGEVCAYCRANGLREPHHHNVWGAVVNSLQGKGFAVKLGYVEPTTHQSHINKVRQWESNLFRGF